MSEIYLSLIIPTWCEVTTIEGAVSRAREAADEVIVVDADSPDGTAAAANRAGARVLHSAKGRGRQLHRGAMAARGSVLLFLHADTEMASPSQTRAAICRALGDERIAGGNCRLRFTGGSFASSLFGWVNHLRRRWLHVYYGDAAIFVRKSVYEQLGGFRPYPIFEDYDFARRLERTHRSAYLDQVSVLASNRRFAQAPVSTVCRWAALHLLYSLAVAPDQLRRLYPDQR